MEGGLFTMDVSSRSSVAPLIPGEICSAWIEFVPESRHHLVRILISLWEYVFPVSWAGYLMERCICIHAHFYQPPRENPWLEAVERQDSAYPYHDWNERITAECYAPNGSSRILDDRGYIRQIVNNYARISFNFGPTLLSWLEENSPETYKCILGC